MDDFTGHYHKILALLMHSFEISEFEISEDSIAAFKREYGADTPAIVWEECGEIVKIRLVSAKESNTLVQ